MVKVLWCRSCLEVETECPWRNLLSFRLECADRIYDILTGKSCCCLRGGNILPAPSVLGELPLLLEVVEGGVDFGYFHVLEVVYHLP